MTFSRLVAQNKSDSLSVNIHLKWNNQPLKLNTIYNSKTDSLQLSTVKFYISGIEFQYEDQSVFKEKNSYHLVDLEDENSLKIPIHIESDKNIAKIIFNIGMDSLASVSGAMEKDLDATKGMYWAWQSGFINMKIEGTSPSCNTRKNQFHFHVGGYLEPNDAMRKVVLNLPKTNSDQNEIPLQIDFAKLFDQIRLKEINSIMIPGKDAMKFADYFPLLFSIQ